MDNLLANDAILASLAALRGKGFATTMSWYVTIDILLLVATLTLIATFAHPHDR